MKKILILLSFFACTCALNACGDAKANDVFASAENQSNEAQTDTLPSKYRPANESIADMRKTIADATAKRLKYENSRKAKSKQNGKPTRIDTPQGATMQKVGNSENFTISRPK